MLDIFYVMCYNGRGMGGVLLREEGGRRKYRVHFT